MDLPKKTEIYSLISKLDRMRNEFSSIKIIVFAYDDFKGCDFKAPVG
jgi:hypothetical protein